MKVGTKRWWTLAGLFLFAVLFCVLFLREARRVGRFPPTAWTEDHKADCAVVLTGGPHRVQEGFDLLARGAVRKLILTGVYPGAKLREVFPQWAYYGHLREEDVLFDRRSKTTFGNAQQSLVLVEALHCRDIVLITTTLHMYRALETFRSVFPNELPIYPRAVVSDYFKPRLSDWFSEASKSFFYSIWAY